MAATDNFQFEDALKRDLPRGVVRKATAYGRDRGLAARWLLPEEMTGDNWKPAGGILLGRRQSRVIGWNDDRHMLTIAGSRAGKGVSLIIPNLIFYEGSAVVVDPKGEIAARTARRRGDGPLNGAAGLKQKVFVLDPFGESGLASNAFNPLKDLKPESPEVVEDIALIADALITHDSHGDRHWSDSAQALLRALILLVVIDPIYRERCHLLTVRELLLLTEKSVQNRMESRPVGAKDLSAEQALFSILDEQAGRMHGYICKGMAEQLRAMGEKERGSILSTARTQTQWLDSPKMPAVLTKTDENFDLRDLKRSNMTIYLCLPATRMATHSRWLRLMVLLSINIMEREKTKPKQPVLFVLDEFPVLGYMQSIETAAGLMAGFGVKLWPILQNIGQLMQHYDKTWETFIANSGIVTAFGVSDNQTLRALSETLGETGIIENVPTGASDQSLYHGAASEQEKQQNLPLLARHEIRTLFGRKRNRLLAFNVEDNPAIIERFTYYDDAYFEDEQGRELYDPDPNFPRRKR